MVDWTGLLTNPLPANVQKVLDTASQFEWDPHPITLAARFSKPSCHPFYIVWELDPVSMKWRFQESRVKKIVPTGLQKLSFRDVPVYLADPTVIEPKRPSIWSKASENDSLPEPQ